MQFSLFLSGGITITNTALLGAIAVLACILGAEIAGICILISKMMRARQRREDEDSYRHYATAPFVLLGAIPQATYSALTVLLILTVAAALVFVALLIVFLACGYDFKATHTKTRASSAPVTPNEEEPSASVLEADESEEQRQEAYTESEEDAFDTLFDEEDAPEEELIEEAADEDAAEESTAVEPIVLQSRTSTVSTVEEPAMADGTRPYKVVEKVVTETVTETYTETPPAEQKTSGLSDAVVEKLVDLLDYEIRTRREQEQKADATAELKRNEGSVPTFARMDRAEDDDEDEDDEDDELETGADGTRDEEDEDFDGEHEGDDDRFTGNERIIGFDEETGCYIVAHYRKSFEAKLIQARPNIKNYYSNLKNALLSYKGSKSRISWTADSFHNGRTQIAKINVKTRILEIYLALDPASLEGTVYRGKNVGDKKKYAETPFQYKVRTPRKFKWAMELVARTCEEHGLSPIDIEPVDYEQQYPFDTTENLVSRKLIKEYVRQEKPATSFELDPDHVPELPVEDASVIPANANFSWEFDNERMEEQAEEPETAAEPETEPIAEPEAVETPAPAAKQSTIVRETVKVTEMRYTERYYADETQTYEQTVTTEREPIEAIAEAVEPEAEPIEEIEDLDTVEELDELEETEEDALAVFAEDEESEAVALDEEPVSEDAEIFFADEEELEEESYEEESYEEEAYEEEACEEEIEEDTDEEEPAFEEIVEEDVAPTPLINVNPSVALVDLCAIESHFENGDVITLDELKARDLVIDSAVTLKVYASGALSKAFTVEAHHFTLDAIRAISEADGDSVMVR